MPTSPYRLVAIEISGLLDTGSEEVSPGALRVALRSLAESRLVVLFDHHAPSAPGRWAEVCQHPGVVPFWSGCLGRQARPPSALPFRWLARKWALRSSECAFLTRSRWAGTGAARAGWHVLQPAATAGGLDEVLRDL